MIEVPITDAANRLTELLERACANGERVFLTQDGTRVAALVSAQELDELEAADDLRHALSLTGDTPPTDGTPLDQAAAAWGKKRQAP